VVLQGMPPQDPPLPPRCIIQLRHAAVQSAQAAGAAALHIPAAAGVAVPHIPAVAEAVVLPIPVVEAPAATVPVLHHPHLPPHRTVAVAAAGDNVNKCQ
jgi:hypothetical protein